jgi:glutamate synthase (NADPH/NADH) large chain
MPSELGDDITLTLDSPLLLEYHVNNVTLSLSNCEGEGSLPTQSETLCSAQNDMESALEKIATDSGYGTFNHIFARFSQSQIAQLQTVTQSGENTQQAIERIAQSAITSVKNGARVVLLDESLAFQNGNGWLGPILVLSIVDLALLRTFVEVDTSESPTPLSLNDNGKIDLGLMTSSKSVNLRRQASIVLRSGAIRNLHDLMMCIGMGADAVSPYLLFESATKDKVELTDEEVVDRLKNVLKALRSGIEKSTSTMGIQEARGYGRLFSSIGLGSEVSFALGAVNYGG